MSLKFKDTKAEEEFAEIMIAEWPRFCRVYLI